MSDSKIGICRLTGPKLVAVSFVLLSMTIVAAAFGAKPPVRPGRMIGPAVRMHAPAARAFVAPQATEKVGEDDPEEQFPGGAALKTDPEQQRLLLRAQQCVADGRLDLAAILWQRVLDEAGDTLMTSDGRTYTSLADTVEATLASLDPRTLQTYRITADGEAQAVLSKAGAEGEEDALGEVVRRYFVSSHGDDAAFRLGCLALDRYDFVGAARLFRKILERHPDPSMPRAEILVRLAIADARIADHKSAEASLQAAAEATGPRPSQETLALVSAELARTSVAATQAATTDWPMPFGSGNRNRHMAALPKEATSRTLTELWDQEFSALPEDQTVANPWSGAAVHIHLSGTVPVAQQAAAASRQELVSQWRQHSWRPATQLLFADSLVFVKSADELVAYSTSASGDQPVWRSVWKNRYELDAMSQMQVMMAANMGLQQTSTRPRSVTEVLLFGDRVHQSMSIADGVIYSLEGRRLTKEAQATPVNPRGVQWGVTPRRTRTNWLSAYDLRSGKAKWQRGASDEDKEGSQDVGFLAAPVPLSSNLLLAPVTDGGTIYLYALKASDGSTAWKTYLCDEPSGGCSPWSQVQIAVDGRDAYIACGTGVVFAVDAVSGGILWATRYERDGEPDQRMRQMYGQQVTPQLQLRGWEDDLVIPHGKALVVLASDSDRLFALDRRSGELLWDSPRNEADYCLGVKGRSLYVAGKNVVRRYDIPTGLMRAETEIGDSFGRGVLTEDAIYLPVRDSIVKLDLEKASELGQVGVSLTSDDPVGNLYSDGEKLWATGAGRVYAMTNLDHRLELLADQIAKGDYEAHFNRMRLYAKQNKHELVFADLRGAYESALKQLTPDAAAKRLFTEITDQRLAAEQPSAVLGLFAELFPPAEASSISKEMVARRSQILDSAIHSLRRNKALRSVDSILQAAPLFNEDYLLTAAAQAVASTATDKDRVSLMTAVGSDSPTSQLLAIPALARIAPAASIQPLSQLVKSPDDRVRLAAARAMLSVGDRSMLETLLSLLESENPRVRGLSHQTLRAATGESIAFASGSKKEERQKGLIAWKSWYVTKGQTAKLKLPLAETSPPLGRVLIALHGSSQVIELDAEQKERWRLRLAHPWGCQGLPNGHRLIASSTQNMVLEYDTEGKEIWRKDGLPSPPFSVQRLDNGNTLVACADVHQVLEISPDGSVQSQTIQGRPLFAQRLENGNTLVALQQGNRVVEMTPDQSIVWEARNLNGPCYAQRLESGNTLVVQASSGKLAELDSAGQVVWSSSVALANPTAAQRLPSGNTLVTDNQGLHEIDAEGKQIIWSQRQHNVTGLSSF